MKSPQIDFILVTQKHDYKQTKFTVYGSLLEYSENVIFKPKFFYFILNFTSFSFTRVFHSCVPISCVL